MYGLFLPTVGFTFNDPIEFVHHRQPIFHLNFAPKAKLLVCHLEQVFLNPISATRLIFMIRHISVTVMSGMRNLVFAAHFRITHPYLAVRLGLISVQMVFCSSNLNPKR